ncbi:MAG: tRNA lysidine(34) synthetase TilS [Phycisphaerae bacterium]|nr:tRNA lysidine(34) synthetase TilS [Phycisphaerae bacterium]
MEFADLHSVIATVPVGRWVVGVSGGSDSMALLRLLVTRDDLYLHVAHLDHELRGDDSTADARFVADAAATLRLPVTSARRHEIERRIANLPANLEARCRAARFTFYAEVARMHRLDGVIVAHQADDVAETILMRLARGSGWWTLRGIEPAAQQGELLVLRPLLTVRRDRLMQYLQSIGQEWREDSTNQSMSLARNRARAILQSHPALFDACLELARACDGLCDWIDGVAPALGEVFAVSELVRRPRIVARLSAMRWLLSQGCPPEECSTEVVDRLIEMCADAASPAKRDFPGSLQVRRSRGVIAVRAP